MSFSGVRFGEDDSCIQFALHDFNRDGVPELLIGNGADAHLNGGAFVFTCKDGEVRCLGEIPSDPGGLGLYSSDDSYYTGLFWTEMFQGDRGTLYYYVNERGELERELVESGTYDDPMKTQGFGSDYHLRSKTSDEALFTLGRDPAVIELVTFDYDTVKKITWDGFVQFYQSIWNRMSHWQTDESFPGIPRRTATVSAPPKTTPTKPQQTEKQKLWEKLLAAPESQMIGKTYAEIVGRYGPLEYVYLDPHEPITLSFRNSKIAFLFDAIDIPDEWWDESSVNDGIVSPATALKTLRDTDFCTGVMGMFSAFGVDRLADYETGFTADALEYSELVDCYYHLYTRSGYEFFCYCGEGSTVVPDNYGITVSLLREYWPESTEPVQPTAGSKWRYDPYAALASAEHVLTTIKGKGAIYVSRLLREGGLTKVKEDGAGDLIDYLNRSGNWDGETIGRVVLDPAYYELDVGDILCSVCTKGSSASDYTNGHGKGKNQYYGIQVFFVSEVGADYVRVYSKNNDRFNEVIRLSCNGGDFIDKCGKCGNSKNVHWIAFCFDDAIKPQAPSQTADAAEGGFHMSNDGFSCFFSDGNGRRVPLGFGEVGDIDEIVAVSLSWEIVANTPDVEGYGFFDVDRDGRKELILKIGTCEADFQYEFYRYDDDVGTFTWIGRVGAGHSELYDGDGTLIKDSAHMGDQTISRIEYIGGKMGTTLIAHYTFGEDEEYYDTGFPQVYLCTKNIYLQY